MNVFTNQHSLCLLCVQQHSWEGERHDVAELNTDFQFGSKKPLGQADLSTAMCNSMKPGKSPTFLLFSEQVEPQNLQPILNLSISPYDDWNNTLPIHSLTQKCI